MSKKRPPTKLAPTATPARPLAPPPSWLVALTAVTGLALTGWMNAAVFFARWTDENVHLYVARRVAQGAVLYRDIHSARPPLALLPLVAGLWAGLPSLWVARGALVLALLATAALVWWAGRTFFGPWQGLAGAVLFLAAPEVAARSAWTGIHLVALGATACVVLAWRQRAFAAGLAGGLALAAGQHAAVLVAGAALVCLVRNRRDALRFITGAALGLGATLGVCALAAGPTNVWQDLVARHLYHLEGAQPAADGDLGFFLASAALENLAWLALAAASMAWPGEERRARVVLGALTLAHLLVVARMTGGLVMYLFPAVPLVALLAGDGLVRVARWAVTAPRARAAAVTVTLLALVAGSFALARARYDGRDGQRYPLLPWLRQVDMALLQQMTVATRVEALIAPVLREGDTIFGFPVLAAAVALDLDRRFAGELADLAPRWISMGLISRETIIRTIEADHVRVFVSQFNTFERDPTFRDYLARCYAKPQVVDRAAGPGSGIPRVNVWVHVDGPCLP